MFIKLRRLLSAVLFVMLVLVIATQLSGLFWNRFHSDWTNPADYPYEALFLGSSHMYRAIIPQYLYNSYGLATVSLASSSQTAYHSMTTLQDYPNLSQLKAVVLDLYAFLRPYTYSMEWNHGLTTTHPERIPEESQNHIFNVASVAIRQMPEYSLKKYWRILNEKELELSTLQYYFSLFNFHSQYLRLGRDNYSQLDDNYLRNKNYQPETMILPIDDPYWEELSEDSSVHMNVQCEAYLRKIIDICQKANVPLILTAMPYELTNSARIVLDEIAAIADETGVTYIGMEDLVYESLFDWTSDMMDKGHVNTTGAEKISDFFGYYLTENFDFTDRSSDENPDNPFLKHTEGYYASTTILTLLQEPHTATDYLESLYSLDESYLLLFTTGSDQGASLTGRQREVLGELGFQIPESETFTLMQINTGSEPQYVSTDPLQPIYACIDAHSLEIDSRNGGQISVDLDVESVPNGHTKLIILDLMSHSVCDSISFGGEDAETVQR